MKIGILTYHFANNYGAVLQVYALQEVLKNYNVETEVIDFISYKQRSNNSIMEDNDSLKSILKNIVRLPHYFDRKKRIEKFEHFRRKYITVSSLKFSLEEEVSQDGLGYDLIIVGSDQVWNPKTTDFHEIYFRISKLNIPVITYAVSLGKAKKEDILPYISDIKNFKCISLREESSVVFLNDLLEMNKCVNVLDPTLLISAEKYLQMSKYGIVKKEPYILCYYLGRKNYVKVTRFMKRISKILNKPVYYINASNGVASYFSNMINNAGPEDFVSLIKGASIVFTNSFHATAISIKLGTSFYTFEESGSNDNRKKDLLKMLGIRNRVVLDFVLNEELVFDNADILKAQKHISTISLESLCFIEDVFEHKM